MTGPRLRRLSRTIAVRMPKHLAETASLDLFNATVSVVTPGASTDGTYAVFFADGTDNVPAPYLAAYVAGGHVPTVGDVVKVLVVNHAPTILDRVIGLPSF